MNPIFEPISLQKLDTDTRKELACDSWRKAEGEELTAFLGFYRVYLSREKGKNHILAFLYTLLVIFVCDFFFEQLLKGEAIYQPKPVMIAIICDVFLLVFVYILYADITRKELIAVKKQLFVTEAIAYENAGKVQLMIDGKRLSFESYPFQEEVSPMDYVHDKDGRVIGFYVRLYLTFDKQMVPEKFVLGTHGYNHYLKK